MKLEEKDFEYIAKGRINKVEGKRMMLWMMGCLVLFGLALAFQGVSQYIPLVVAVGCVIVIWWTNNELNKKINALQSKLWTEYVDEQQKRGL